MEHPEWSSACPYSKLWLKSDRSEEDKTFLVNLFLQSFCDKILQSNQSSTVVDAKEILFGIRESVPFAANTNNQESIM